MGARSYLYFIILLVVISVPVRAESDSDHYEYSRGELFSIIRTQVPGSDVFSLPRNFNFPDDARESSTFVVDFSHHVEAACGCEIDWNGVADAKAAGVYLKATQGKSYTDPSLARNVNAIAATGRLDAGVYHFMSSVDAPGDQASHFLASLDAGWQLGLPPSLDLEWDPGPMRDDCPNDAVIVIRKRNGDVTRKCDRWSEVSADEIIDRANVWLDAVRDATGREPVLYTSDAWLKPRLGDDRRAKALHARLLWIADYSKGGLAKESPKVPNGMSFDLWQFTDGAGLGTGRDRVTMDASIFQGDRRAMSARLGSR